MTATVADRYREVRRLGTGGMASVMLAEDTVLGREVALKRVRGTGDQRAVERLRREARVGASLNHHNLVAVYDVLIEDDDLVIVMEYVPGRDLRKVLDDGPLPPGEVLEVVRGVGAALDHAHRDGVIHRDVKPGNVLLGPGVVKLSDLGIALALALDQSRLTVSGAVVGSAAYMSPEQFGDGEIGPATDVYALAAVAFEALSGRRARPETGPVSIARAAISGPPDLLEAWPAAPPAAAAVLRRGLDPEPARRHASGGELAAALAEALGTSAPAPAPAPAPPTLPDTAPMTEPFPAVEPSGPAQRTAPVERAPAPGPAPRRRGGLLALLSLVAVVVVVVILVVALGGGGDDATPSPVKHAQKKPAAKSAAKPAGGGGGAAPDPAGTVRAFYTDQAAHRFASAWALAGDNLKSELGGLSSFEGGSSTLRSITFDDLKTTSTSGDSATVSLRTTATHTDHVDHCSGTAGLVRSGDGWLIDHIGISC